MTQNITLNTLTEPTQGESLKYPILLVHGMGFTDGKRRRYWGRIPQILALKGCKVFFGMQDCNGTIQNNAYQLSQSLQRVLKETNVKKVNIIAHSKGGLEARYLVSKLGLSESVASITFISTPHRGSVTVDKIIRLFGPLVFLGSKFVDLWHRILGDKKPNTYKAICSLQTKIALAFNAEVLDSPNVYYQSYAFVMKHFYSDFSFFVTNLVVKLFEGANDGLLAPSAVKWGEFRGVFSGTGNRGISHMDEVDFRRKKLSKKSGEGIQDITEIYLEILHNLVRLGF